MRSYLMALKDDGDIVRGLGFVTLYAAYIEEAVEAGRSVLVGRDPEPPKGIGRWPISAQVKYMRDRVAALAPLPSELSRYPDLLDHVSGLLERRNDVVHGRIYAGMQGDGDELRPSRPGGTAKTIASAELYELANSLFDTLNPLNHACMFALKRLP
jgi:hypothetical protein